MKILRWILVAFFGLSAFGAMVGGSVLSAVFLVSATFFAIPGSERIVNSFMQKKGLDNSFGARSLVGVGVLTFFIGVALFEDSTAPVDGSEYQAQNKASPAENFFRLDVNEFRSEFNHKAGELGLSSDYLIDSLNVTSGSVNDVFQYSFTDKPVAITGTVEKDGERLKGLTIIFVPDGTESVYDALIVMGTAIMTFSPEMERDARGQLINRLISEAKSTDEIASEYVGNVKYSVSISDQLGVWFMASPSKTS